MPLYMGHSFCERRLGGRCQKCPYQRSSCAGKYGVTYHQYWFNEEAGTIYCLMEGPDKESCAATHREANGIIACQIVEVEGGYNNPSYFLKCFQEKFGSTRPR